MSSRKRRRLYEFALVVFLIALIAGPWIITPSAMLATYAAVLGR
jgi:hypothetical protein